MDSIIIMFSDAFAGKLSFFANLINDYGWNPGKKLLKYLEKILQSKTGIENVTFKQVTATIIIFSFGL